MASSGERAVNFAVRVQGVGQAEADFKRVGQAGEQSISAIAKAAAAQSTYEAALGKADSASAAFAAAQGETKQQLAALSAQVKAGTATEQQYQAAVLQTKNSLALVRAEYSQSKSALDNAAKAVVASRVAMNDQDDILNKVTKSTGNARLAQLEWQHVMRAGTGAILAGMNPVQALTLEMGRIVEATQLSLGGTSKFASFMGGPWGIALGLGAGAAIQFGLSMLKGKDATAQSVEELQKHAEKTRTDEAAQAAFGHTIQGVTQAIEENHKALEKLNLVQETSAEKALKEAQAQRLATIEIRKKTVADLEAAKAAEELLIKSTGAGSGVEGGGAAAAGIAAQQQRVDQLTNDLKSAREALAKEENNVITAQADVTVERARASEEDRINRLYNQRIDAAKRLAISEGKVGDQLDRQVRALEAQRQAALKAAQDSQHHLNNAQTGRELTGEQAAAIARSAGLQVNSSSRTYAQQKALYDAWVAKGRPADNPVAMPGTSAHEGANGRWALDIQFGQGVTPELLRKVFAAQGVSLTKVFAERGHFHVEGSRSQADSEAAAADKAAQEAAREQQDYQNRLATLMGAELEARRALVSNPETLAAIQRAEIETAKKKYDQNLDSLVAEGKLQADHAAQLKDINDQTAALRLALVDRAEQERKLNEQQAAAERAASYRETQIGQEETLLKGQEDMLQSQAERRAIEHRLIALQYEQEKIQNDLVIAYANRLKELNAVRVLQGQEGVAPEALRKAAAAADEAGLRNATMGGRQAQATAQSDRQTAGPFEAYLAKMPHTAAEFNERAQGYVVDELEAVRQGIDNALSSAIGVKDPLIAGLIDLLVQSVLIDPLTEILQKRAAAGGAGGGGGLGGFLSKVLGIAGAAVGGGPSAALVPSVSAAMAANPGLFASGTDSVPSGRPFWVGENGRELMQRTAGGGLRVLSNQESHRLMTHNSGPAIGHVTINIPERADPRRTASTVSRGLQNGLSRSARKGLAGGIA